MDLRLASSLQPKYDELDPEYNNEQLADISADEI
jgi:hypothetical protein